MTALMRGIMMGEKYVFGLLLAVEGNIQPGQDRQKVIA